MSTFTWKVKWTHTGLRFQTDVKTSHVHIKFHFSCISKWPNILTDMCRHFISGSVHIFYHPKWNFISVKMTDMKSIHALRFKCTWTLNATSKKSALIHFVSRKLCSHENLMPVWNFMWTYSMTWKVKYQINSLEIPYLKYLLCQKSVIGLIYLTNIEKNLMAEMETLKNASVILRLNILINLALWP